MTPYYNPELNKVDFYKDIYQDKYVNVKGEKVLVYNLHILKDKNGEEWVDFKYPNENLYAAFDAYRNKKYLLFPDEIKQIRKNNNLSLNEFAKILEIDVKRLKSLENNSSLQTQEENDLIVSFKNNFRLK